MLKSLTMKLRQLVFVWLIVLGWMSYEYLVLHRVLPTPSVMQLIACDGLKLCKRINPAPGRTLSYTLGWLGFCIMALTNLYVLRKRMLKLQKVGNLQVWLDWHIFCGMLGPTFILFHSDFKVGGLVSISFWSMVVSFLSGIIGRYFYMQLLQGKIQLKKTIESYEGVFDRYVKSSGRRITEQHMLAAKAHAFAMAGGVQGDQLKQMGVLSFLYHSLVGELRMSVALPPVPWRESRQFRKQLANWAVMRRRLVSLHYYHLLFGYWRAFHTPFAIWMYVVAVIHIVSSLIFRVPA